MAKLVPVKEVPAVEYARSRSAEHVEWHALLAPAQRRRVGQWWRIEPAYDRASTAASCAYDINSRRYGSLPEGEWEAQSRGCHVYVRLVAS